jgi:putative membrane protein
MRAGRFSRCAFCAFKGETMSIRTLSFLAASALAISATSAIAQNKDSQKFISTAIQHNYAEIDAGKLAQEKGTNPVVKEYGAMLVRDHGAANEKAQAVAKELKVDPPTGADVMHKASYVKLKVLSGDTFDKSFVNGMVSDHDADVKEFKKQASKSGPAAAHAKEVLPKLEAHLAEAKKIQTQLSGKKR